MSDDGGKPYMRRPFDDPGIQLKVYGEWVAVAEAERSRLVTRCAEAAWEARDHKLGWDDLTPEIQDFMRNEARAVIKTFEDDLWGGSEQQSMSREPLRLRESQLETLRFIGERGENGVYDRELAGKDAPGGNSYRSAEARIERLYISGHLDRDLYEDGGGRWYLYSLSDVGRAALAATELTEPHV